MWRTTSAELEKKLGRYLTAPELEILQQGATSKKQIALRQAERAAVSHIWPGMQLGLKLERIQRGIQKGAS